MKLLLLPCLCYTFSDVFTMAGPRLLLGEAGLFNNQHNVFSVLCVGTQMGESPPFHVHTAHSLPPSLMRSHPLQTHGERAVSLTAPERWLDFAIGMNTLTSVCLCPVVNFRVLQLSF